MSYALRVLTQAGREETIAVDAGSEAEALRKAAALGVTVVGIARPDAPRRRAGGRFSLLLFSQELLALLEAGLNLTEALTTLQRKERAATARTLLDAVVRGLQQGGNFSDVLARHPEHFPELYVATVRAAERTGNLQEVLARYIGYQLQFDAIRKKLVAAAIYPVMLVLVGGFIALFLLGYVVPRFSAVYDAAGRDISLLSAALLGFGRFLNSHGWQVALGAVAGAGALGWGLAHPGARRRLAERFFALPWLARKSDEFRMARFYRACSLLLQAGIPLPKALSMLAGLLSMPQQARLARARRELESGKAFSDVLLAHALAGPIDESLIKVGERAGRLADMLERVARFYDDDFARWLDWLSRLLEPVLMALIGLVIGTVVVLLYVPILDLAGGLQ
ncbi:type II secretion system F family protein [Chitiniphilus purpureus]|uniref:Type II secretion system F family protein n=1 Tax=Chitiniphilus purpureus TaxID=2981137 RepID=A0ABY6DLI3_9NEIS|nr:type II secretion system F family protein [Chitiniphilus sp. CD1]UXY15220.1 type II secretion system F family protein [Chitiniphilus sp. CD1]